MGYARYPRGTQPGDYYGGPDDADYGTDNGNGRADSYSSARDYEAAGIIGPRNPNGRDPYSRGRDAYGGRNYQNRRPVSYDRADFDGPSEPYHGSYAAGGRRFEDVGRDRHADDDRYNDPDQRWENRDRATQQRQRSESHQRGFFERAGDEVRSWFGDEEAEHRRERDEREFRRAESHRDRDYHNWRAGQIAALDRDYDEYRNEHRSKFETEFSTWRTNRQGQRDSLNKVEEKMEVVGSDGEHIGVVDKVRGDRILLTRSDKDAGGRHHSIPSAWIVTVDEKVTVSKTGADAKQAWKDEDRQSAMFGYGDQTGGGDDRLTKDGRVLNKSFSGTY